MKLYTNLFYTSHTANLFLWKNETITYASGSLTPSHNPNLDN
jgi:hypothetical protein